LHNGPFPALFLTVSVRAHVLLCDPATHRVRVLDGDQRDLWQAWWNGSWNGPKDLGDGPIG